MTMPPIFEQRHPPTRQTVAPVATASRKTFTDSHSATRVGLLTQQDELDAKVTERTLALAHSHEALKQTQAQLVKSEKLAFIGQLLASVAHEINDPIAVMRGNLDLVRETLGPHAQPMASELKLMDQQIDRMRLIVTQLLQYARPNDYAGYVEAVDVNDTMASSLVLVAHLLTNTTITGAGLSDATRKHLFSPFFTTKSDGNNLGLWISVGLLERYGGSISAYNRSDQHKGSTGAGFGSNTTLIRQIHIEHLYYIGFSLSTYHIRPRRCASLSPSS